MVFLFGIARFLKIEGNEDRLTNAEYFLMIVKDEPILDEVSGLGQTLGGCSWLSFAICSHVTYHSKLRYRRNAGWLRDWHNCELAIGALQTSAISILHHISCIASNRIDSTSNIHNQLIIIHSHVPQPEFPSLSIRNNLVQLSFRVKLLSVLLFPFVRTSKLQFNPY